MLIYLAKMAKIHKFCFSQFLVRFANGYMANTNGNPVCINWNMHRLRILLNSIHHPLIVSHLLVHNHKQNYCNSENIHLFIIKLQVALRRSTFKRVKMHVATAGCEGPL